AVPPCQVWPNGLRLSGDGGEAAGVRCSRGLGDGTIMRPKPFDSREGSMHRRREDSSGQIRYHPDQQTADQPMSRLSPRLAIAIRLRNRAAAQIDLLAPPR